MSSIQARIQRAWKLWKEQELETKIVMILMALGLIWLFILEITGYG